MRFAAPPADAAAVVKAAKRAGWPMFKKPTDEEVQAIADLLPKVDAKDASDVAIMLY